MNSLQYRSGSRRIKRPTHKVIHLLGEEHDEKGKALWQVAMIHKISKNHSPLRAISFELDHNCFQKNLDRYDLPGNAGNRLLLRFAQQREVPLFAFDMRDQDALRNENRLEEQLALNISDDLLDEYRKTHWTNHNFRDDYTTIKIHEFLNGFVEGTLIHLCGLAHLNGLERRLTNLGYDVRVNHIREVKRTKPSVIETHDDILLSSHDYIGAFVSSNGEPQGPVTKRIAERYPKPFRHYSSSDDGEAKIDHVNIPPLCLFLTPETTLQSPSSARDYGWKVRDFVENSYLPSIAMPELPTTNQDVQEAFKEGIGDGILTEVCIYKTNQ